MCKWSGRQDCLERRCRSLLCSHSHTKRHVARATGRSKGTEPARPWVNSATCYLHNNRESRPRPFGRYAAYDALGLRHLTIVNTSGAERVGRRRPDVGGHGVARRHGQAFRAQGTRPFAILPDTRTSNGTPCLHHRWFTVQVLRMGKDRMQELSYHTCIFIKIWCMYAPCSAHFCLVSYTTTTLIGAYGTKLLLDKLLLSASIICIGMQSWRGRSLRMDRGTCPWSTLRRPNIHRFQPNECSATPLCASIISTRVAFR